MSNILDFLGEKNTEGKLVLLADNRFAIVFDHYDYTPSDNEWTDSWNGYAQEVEVPQIPDILNDAPSDEDAPQETQEELVELTTPEDERASLRKTIYFEINPALALETPETVTLVENGDFIFSERTGSALFVHGTDDTKLTAILSVQNGELNFDEKIPDGVEMVASEAGDQITLTNIDEHDLSALLEGLRYTAAADYTGSDQLQINIEGGGETQNSVIDIDVISWSSENYDILDKLLEQNGEYLVFANNLKSFTYSYMGNGDHYWDLDNNVQYSGYSGWGWSWGSRNSERKTLKYYTVEIGEISFSESHAENYLNNENIWTHEKTSSNQDGETGTRIISYYMPNDGEAEAPSALRVEAINKAIAEFEKVLDVRFVQVDSYENGAADIIFNQNSLTGANIILGVNESSETFILEEGDRINYNDLKAAVSMTMRDLGGALGLRHHDSILHTSNKHHTIIINFLDTANHVFENTIMAYSNLDYDLKFNRGQQSSYPQQLQIYDIRALQSVYGENTQANIGDDYYDLTSNGLGSGYHTIYDRGGIDTLYFGLHESIYFTVTVEPNYYQYSGANFIYLEPGTRSNIYGIDDLVIAEGTIIENVIGTVYTDRIYGNDADNVLEGGWGERDVLDGGAGSDTASYEHSIPLYENSIIGVNVDLTKTVQTSQDGITTEADGDVLISIENLIGTARNDILIGNRDHNILDGGAGGNDILTGGGGRDTFIVEFGAGLGHDTITDWQRGIDNLVVRTQGGLLDLAAAFDAGQIGVRRPNANTFEVFLTDAPQTDYIRVEFIDSTLDTNNFRTALGGNDHITTELLPDEITPVQIETF